MTASASLRSEERIGLLVALLLHAALVAALLLQAGKHKPFPLPERMVVSLAEDVALEATAPVPAQESQAAIAPTLSEEPAPASEPEVSPRSDPINRQIERASPKPTQAKPTPAKPTPAKPAIKKGGGARIGNDFLKGATSGERSESAAMPASAIGPVERASLGQAIARQLKPHWSAPQGVDADLLVTVLSFDLNPDGSLAGAPRVVTQAGITDANRAQAGRHAEQAIRAVQLSAPFDLPTKYYNVWKRIKDFRFDRNTAR